MTSPPRGPDSEAALRDLALQLLDRAGLRPEHHVLELDCGDGWLVRLLADLLGGGRVFGVDPSPKRIDLARSTPHPPRVSFTQAEARELPFAPASLDRVLCLAGLSRWPDPAAGLAEVHRVLKPGGGFLGLLFPGSEALPGGEAWLARLRGAGFAAVAAEEIRDRRPEPPAGALGRALLLRARRPD